MTTIYFIGGPRDGETMEVPGAMPPSIHVYEKMGFPPTPASVYTYRCTPVAGMNQRLFWVYSGDGVEDPMAALMDRYFNAKTH